MIECEIEPQQIQDGIWAYKKENEFLRDSEKNLCSFCENIFKVLAETSRGAIFLYQEDKIVYVNPSMVMMTGYSEPELLGMKFWDWVHPGYRKQIKVCGHARQRGKNVPPQYEVRYVTAQGEDRWGIISAGYVEYQGKPAGIATVIDISDRKRIEHELQRAHEELERRVTERTSELAESLADLRESEKRYRLLFENMQDGLAYCRMVFDVEGRPSDFVYMDVNKVHNRLTGLDNVVGKRVTEVIPGIGELHPELFEVFGRVALSGRPEKFEIEIKPLGRWFSVSAYCVEKRHFVAVFDNITERKESEGVLRCYELLAANSRDIILFIQRDNGRVLEANAAAVNAYKYSRDELLSLTIHDLRAPETGILTTGQMVKADTHGILFETIHRCKDNSTFPVEVSSQGATIFGTRTLICVIRDITERKRVDSLVRNLNVELERRVYERTDELLKANETLMEEIAERKRAQEALRKSEARYRALFENSIDAIFLTVPDGKIMAANRAACKMFGMTEGEFFITGREGIIDATDSRYSPALEERARTGRIFCELTYVRKDGTKFPAETSSCILDNGSKSFVILRDITDRKQAEEALRESDEFSRQVIASANEGVIVMDRDLRYQVWNPYMEQLTGLPAARALGGHPLELFPSLGENGIFENIKKARGGQKTEPCECHIHALYHDRSYWILTSHAPLRNTKGEIIGVIATVREITARKNAEKMLHRANAYNRSLIEASLDPLVTIGPDGGITDVNASTEEVTGYPRERLVGTDFSDYFTDTEAARDGYQKVFREGVVRDYPLVIRHWNGVTTPVLYNATVFKDEAGNVTGVFAAARDITERRKAEEITRNYTRRLMEMEEDLRKKLAAELHDEIGRDLTALGINCSIISSQLPADLYKRLENRMDDSVRLIEEVTRTVRNIMNRLRPPMLDDYGLPAALRWYTDLFSRRTGIEARILVDEDCPRLTEEKETALFRIAQEALTNTAKHAAARNVTVMLGCRAGMIRLSIADDGKGFVPETVSTFLTGSCWGLTVMRERAELFGGNFKVDSTPGSGTTVAVEIREEYR